MLFTSKKPQFEYLRKKWTQKHRSLMGRQLALGGLGGLMLLTMPTGGLLTAPHLLAKEGLVQGKEDKNAILAGELSKIVPKEMRSLTPQEEEEIAVILSKNFGFTATSSINNIRLNRSYGLIGGEQHLYRYPGDNLFKHADNAVDVAMYIPAGIAPGLGAWGYFVPSESQFTEKDSLREKYYLAVQTFLAPGFAENVAKYRDFFRFRKMIVVNPQTGQAVVAVIGDAGPAEWTGKHLGGSPEVMHFLGLAEGSRKGPVLYFFIDDPDDKIPLGQIKIENKT